MKLNVRASSLHAAVIGLSNSIIQAASAFGAHLSSDQNLAITGLVNSLLVILSLLIINGTSPSVENAAAGN